MRTPNRQVVADLVDAVHRCEAWEREEDHIDQLLARAGTAGLFLFHGGHSSLADWLLHLIAASVIWHLVGALVYAHPLVALAVGAAALVAIALIRRGRSARS